MIENYQVTGVYDSRTIKCLQEVGVQDIIFDLRPRSFNFIQKHLVSSLLKENQTFSGRIGLWFENEKDFMIQDLLSEVLNFVSKDKVFLILSGNYSVEFFKSIELDFYCIYQQDLKVQSIISNSSFKGFYLYFDFLEGLYTSGSLNSWVNNFYTQIFRDKVLDIILLRDWDSNIFPSLVELIDFSTICLPINAKVEVCFRNVDINKLKSSFENSSSYLL